MSITIAPLSQFQFSDDERRAIVETLCNMERIEYGEGCYRLPEVFIEMIAKNDAGLICAIEDGQLLGYADVWQLKSRFYNELLYGIKAEEEICTDYVLSKTDEGTGYWYVGSVITDSTFRQIHTVKAAHTFSEIFKQVYQILNNVKVPAKIMGVGSTDFGRKLLARHGFEPVASSPQAIDFRLRYEKTLFDLQLA